MNINPNIESTSSQNSRILAWFLSGHSLTQWEASDRDNPMHWNCINLSGRIDNLEKAGWVITKTWESHTSTDPYTGKPVTKRFKRYSIAPENRKLKED